MPVDAHQAYGDSCSTSTKSDTYAVLGELVVDMIELGAKRRQESPLSERSIRAALEDFPSDLGPSQKSI
ncbi:hypothetical protein PGT21_033928 [Puccinia graminis f. sp. tritici]|uniref:Uncharacterized protein n=1 Tax=Puccinia graminis f. sp. tritici TaxID=56615 RepID=A0A5B0LNR3_PUCGR|nr:hypothetical protein PGT21_033928 [Puccinia graminis f. sp. tritici]KAA1081821.1 hypothetical protein PGTUg99_013955 [Puccinia graminis f. sp. tritici]